MAEGRNTTRLYPSPRRKIANSCLGMEAEERGGGEGPRDGNPGKGVSVVMVPDAPLLIKDGWLAGWLARWMDGWRSRDAILICAIIMCT